MRIGGVSLASALVAMGAAAACGSESGGGGKGGCPQGETRACVGPGACQGGQTCGKDGSWGACDCGGGSGGGGAGGGPSGGAAGSGSAGGAGGSGGGVGGTAGGGGTGGGVPISGVPSTCAEAGLQKSTYGCEFWPTVTPTSVWSIFDFAIVVVNPHTASVDVTVTRAGTTVNEKLAGKTSKIIFLPWVSGLKGDDSNCNGSAVPSGGTVRVDGGAYRVTSSLPVGVTQFSPIEYKDQGGPPGKSWAACPGLSCSMGCFAYTADSSVLLPTSALGTSYRAVGPLGWSTVGLDIGPTLTVTAASDNTKLSVTLSFSATLKGGGGISAQPAGGTFELYLNKSDVVVLQGQSTADLSGTLISADKPVQVISGASCVQVPQGTQACDHLEDALPPAHALGKSYVVPVPQGPKGAPVSHVVKIVGHVDGTNLTYSGTKPAKAPSSLAAGQLADLGLVAADFSVVADQPIAVMSFIPGGALLDPLTPAPNQVGDPALRQVVSVSQFRTQYSVSAAPDYPSSHFELVVPSGATVTLDGNPVTGTPKAIGTSGFGVLTIPADATGLVFHTLTGDKPFGLQLVGYGQYTAYAHPGGFDAKP
ncbi:MAG: IgGFc-binding protein [Myxococcales bacterium]|nr:IgGFc-binding protein [Myxococcales bacterium]